MKNGVMIRVATVGDAGTLARIGGETFYETWRPVNTEEDMQKYIATAFAPDTIREDLERDENTFLLAATPERVVGYAKMRRDRTHAEFGGEKAIEIERLYVAGDFQGYKIGKALMDACLEIAQNETYSWIWLGVNIDNEKAIAFYKKYGFTVFGTKQFKLGDAVDDDYLMKKNLPHSG